MRLIILKFTKEIQNMKFFMERKKVQCILHTAWCMFVACLGTESRRHVFHGGANEEQGLRQCVLFHIHVREELLPTVKLCIISSDEWDIARYDYTDAARWAVTMSG